MRKNKLRAALSENTTKTLPPLSTHNVEHDDGDAILGNLRRCQLFNAPDDRVKVIFHPAFLKETSPLFPISYQDFVQGTHLGLFPSYYEPWGYTPAECAFLGVPSITSNLSGFGCYINEKIRNPSTLGIYVVDRRCKNIEESSSTASTG
ncbi:hypothetical protein MTO96_028065 [Rhipicephalus appendiculatus]